jgi:acetoin utilization deacetylase AcuC-like enzyme
LPRDWPVIGDRFSGFPAAMEHALSLEGVRLFEPQPALEELLLKVHNPRYLEEAST